MSKKKKKSGNWVADTLSKMRNTWGALSPVTKVIPNKKKDPRIKHKGKIDND